MAEWQTPRDVRDRRQQQRDELRRLRIEWADKYWLALNHPVSDSVLAWLAENRAEASKIGSSRWHLETLPALINRQHQLRTAEEFQRILDRCAVSTDSTESPITRAPRKDRGKARRRPSQTTPTHRQ
jgi:hypothetical protein